MTFGTSFARASTAVASSWHVDGMFEAADAVRIGTTTAEKDITAIANCREDLMHETYLDPQAMANDRQNTPTCVVGLDVAEGARCCSPVFPDAARAEFARIGAMTFLARPGDRAARLREPRARPEPLTAPGCYDALGARLIEEAGFDVDYVTGFGTSASLLGRPDVGLANEGEMLDNIRRIVAATSLPVIADADTGYGNQMNVIRTVQLWEQAGAAGFHLEDQVTPKKFGRMNNKQVIPGRGRGKDQGRRSCSIESRHRHHRPHRRSCRPWPRCGDRPGEALRRCCR